jgi:hypothetical protein
MMPDPPDRCDECGSAMAHGRLSAIYALVCQPCVPAACKKNQYPMQIGDLSPVSSPVPGHQTCETAPFRLVRE